MTALQIKRAAREHFENQNFKECFELLSSLSIGEFISYARKSDLKKDKSDWISTSKDAGSQFFWTHFVDSTFVKRSIIEGQIDQLCHIYFSKFKQYSWKFELLLIETDVAAFIKNLRLNKAFLDAERLSFLSNLNVPIELAKTLQHWQFIYNQEKKLLDLIGNYPNDISFEKFIAFTSLFTRNFFNGQGNPILTDSVFEYLNDSLERFFGSKKVGRIDGDKVYRIINHLLQGSTVDSEYRDFVEYSQNISRLQSFHRIVINPYCYDQNTTIERINNKLHLCESPKSYYLYRLDGVRYQLLQTHYLWKSVESGFLLPNDQYSKAIDLCLKDLFIEEKDSYQMEVVSAFMELGEQTSEYPVIVIDKASFVDLIHQRLKYVQSKESSQIIEEFFVQDPTKKGRFSVKENPFLKIGDNIVFFPICLTGNNWFYPIIQKLLRYRRCKKEIISMEDGLGKKFEAKNWTVKLPTEKQASQINGDVDLIIEDKYEVLYIQLKRTAFRFNPQESYNEFVKSDLHASYQLNDAESFLSKPNNIYTTRKKVTKWIVSTSFERTNQEINGCRKVNYFELLNALNNPNVLDLKDLINDIVTDRNILLFKEAVIKKGLELARFQLLFRDVDQMDHKQYVTQIEYEEEDLKFANLFNESLDKSDARQHDASIDELFKLHQINPSDVDVLFGLASEYANIKDYKSSIHFFEKALSVAKDDPRITRDYYLTLYESGAVFQSLIKAKEVIANYPLYADCHLWFERNFNECLGNGKLKPEEVIVLGG